MVQIKFLWWFNEEMQLELKNRSYYQFGQHHAKKCLWAYADTEGIFVQSDQGLHCLLTESLDTKKV